MALFYEVCFSLSSCIKGLVAVDGHGYIKGLVDADGCGCRWVWLYYLSLQHLLDMIVYNNCIDRYYQLNISFDQIHFVDDQEGLLQCQQVLCQV